MKKITMIAGAVLLIVGMLATTAFAPLSAWNGVVTNYAAGKSITIRNNNVDHTYILNDKTVVLPSANANTLGLGARATVFGDCFSTGRVTTTVVTLKGAHLTTSSTGNGNGNNNNGKVISTGGLRRTVTTTERACMGFAVVVYGPAPGSNAAVPGTGATSAPGATMTPAAPSGGAGTPAVTPTATP